jgi:drug/metabolite transporter (DMT)-like permease
MHHGLGLSLALLSAASWAVGALLYKRASAQLPPLILNLVTSVAGLGVLALCWGLSTAVAASPPQHALALHALPQQALPLQALAQLAVSGLVGIALGDTLFFAALRDLSGHATVVLAALSPVLSALLAVVVLDERPSARAGVGAALVVAGVAVVLNAQAADAGPTQTRRRGIMLGLAAVLAMANGTLLAKPLLQQVAPLEATLVRMAAGVMGLGAVTWCTRQPWRAVRVAWQPPYRGPLATGGVVVAIGGFWGLHASLQAADLSVVAAVHACEPLFALPLARWLLGERIPPRAVAGAVVAVLGLGLLYAA